jgi:hypothetical protein
MNNTTRWIAVTVLLATGAAVAKGEEPASGDIHSDKTEMSRKGNQWKDNSTTASPFISTGTIIHSSKERMSRKGTKWKNNSTTAAPSVSTGATVSPSPR